MSIITDITADNRLATAVVAALENVLGGDLILGVGRPRNEPPSTDLVPAPPVRVVRLALSHGASGGAYLALSDSLIQHVIGKGIVGRLSARFGEGAVNGILTARIGLAARDVCRPIPQEPEAKETLTALIREIVSLDGEPPADATASPQS